MRAKSAFGYGTITLSSRPSQVVLLTQSTSARPRSLAATWGISIDIFSSGYLDVSVLQVRLTLCTECDTAQKQWVAPFGHVRIKACLPAPRTFSQAHTSFIASSCQGIRPVRLFT